METKVVAITGASNGMGYEAVQLFAKQGWQVFAGARRVEKIPKAPQITALKLDVTDTASNHTFVQQILEKAGRIDVLINNAGYGEFGAAEEVPLHAVCQQFETNFFGAVELTQLVLPTMHQQTSGRIINISSIVGDIYLPLGAYYNASKAALQQWSNVLDLEISPFGLRSIVVQPGDTVSDWGTIAIENAQKNLLAGSVYQPLTLAVEDQKHRPGAKVATSADLASVFYKAATDNQAAFRYYHSLSDHICVAFARIFPRSYKKLLTYIVKKMVKENK